MTLEEFRKLPMLLATWQARAVLGCDRELLRKMRQSNPDLAVKVPGMIHPRYRKVVVARLAHLEYE